MGHFGERQRDKGIWEMLPRFIESLEHLSERLYHLHVILSQTIYFRLFCRLQYPSILLSTSNWHWNFCQYNYSL